MVENFRWNLGTWQRYPPGLYIRGAVAFGGEEEKVLRYLDDCSVLLCHGKRDGIKGKARGRTAFMFGHGLGEIARCKYCS